jgi:uncharacterized repeat protein (TIGR02543 family)
MPANPARSGYVFGGWYTAANGGGTAFTASTTVSGNITVYAKWTAIYTVTFNADGGSPATQTRTVNSGSSVGSSNMPANPTKSGYTFDGWYTVKNGGGTQFTALTMVSGNIMVYAKWTALPFNDALAWINANAVAGGAYTITLTRDETIMPITLSCGGKNVSVTIRGDATKRTISLSSKGSLFTVESGVTLTLDNNTVLRGRSDNNKSLVWVKSGGKLVMNTGSEISGNIAAASGGGGVYVGNSGTFTMSGGIISGNTAAGSSSDPAFYGGGGGVCVYSGTFTMNGGTISGNTISYGYGGGVSVFGSTFVINGGTISGNTSSQGYGGGVSVSGIPTSFGSINSTFTMSGGTISGNTASYGGGVSVNGGTFTMSDGTISGNTSTHWGGGIYVVSGTFTKQSGGIIYGVDANALLKNTATNGDDYGHAVYVYVNGGKKRDTTAGVGVTLDRRVSGATGGWE